MSQGREQSIRHGKCRDFALQAIAEPVLFDFQVITCLQIQPKPFRRPEVPCQPKCRVRSDRTLPPHHFVYLQVNGFPHLVGVLPWQSWISDGTRLGE